MTPDDPDSPVEFVSASGGGVDEELDDRPPPRRPWWLLLVGALIAAGLVAAVGRQHPTPGPSAEPRPSASDGGVVIPSFTPAPQPRAQRPPALAFPVPQRHPTATVTMDRQLPILGGPSGCEPCHVDTRVPHAVRTAVRAAFPGTHVAYVASAIDLPRGLHRQLENRLVLAVGGGTVLLLLIERQGGLARPHREDSPDGRLRTCFLRRGAFFVQATSQTRPARRPPYARLRRLARDPRLTMR